MPRRVTYTPAGLSPIDSKKVALCSRSFVNLFQPKLIKNTATATRMMVGARMPKSRSSGNGLSMEVMLAYIKK